LGLLGWFGVVVTAAYAPVLILQNPTGHRLDGLMFMGLAFLILTVISRGLIALAGSIRWPSTIAESAKGPLWLEDSLRLRSGACWREELSRTPIRGSDLLLAIMVESRDRWVAHSTVACLLLTPVFHLLLKDVTRRLMELSRVDLLCLVVCLIVFVHAYLTMISRVVRTRAWAERILREWEQGGGASVSSLQAGMLGGIGMHAGFALVGAGGTVLVLAHHLPSLPAVAWCLPLFAATVALHAIHQRGSVEESIAAAHREGDAGLWARADEAWAAMTAR
jgi:hypothetical protein